MTAITESLALTAACRWIANREKIMPCQWRQLECPYKTDPSKCEPHECWKNIFLEMASSIPYGKENKE